jgi:hypothetical protein
MDVIEAYWCFGASGPEQLDFKPVWDAARKTIPGDHWITKRLEGRASFPNLTMSIAALSPWRSTCCDYRGTVRGIVRVKFKMEQCRIRVADADFQPNAERP